MLATEKQIPDVYHLHLVSDWWRAKLRANVGAKMLKRGDWRQLFHKATCECCGENGVDTTKHRGESAVTIYGVEGLMFDYGPEWAEKGEAHPSWLIEEREAKWIGGEALMIGQFGPYENSASASGEHNNGRTVYAIRLKEIEDCLTTCTQKWHQQRLTRETHLLRRKLNATSTEVHTCGLPDSHIRQWRKVFDAKQKRVMKLEAMNGPTTQRLYQSVTDAYFKHSRDAGEVETGDEVIQVMGGMCLKVLRNMREIEDDFIPSVNSVMVGTDLATALVNRGLGEEIAIHKYEFRQDKEHKKQVVEIRQVGTKELMHNDSDVPVRGLLVIVHLTGADAHCFLVKTDVHKSREDWWNKYTDEVVKELTAEAHQRSWEIHATKEGRVELSDKVISGLKIRGIPGKETPRTLAEALRGKQQNAKTEALIDFWDAYTTEGKIIQLASGRHLRAILKLLNAHETYAIVAHDVEGQDPMTATVYTDGLVGDKSCTPQKRTVTIAEEEEEIVQKCTRFLRGTKGWSLPIISTGTAARLGFRAILPLTDVILSNVQGAHNGVKTAASTNMKITAADVEGLDETYDGCYVAMRMTEGSLAEQMNESTYWRWRAEQTEIVYGEADGRLQERMIECVQEAEGCVQAVLYTRDEHIVEMSGGGPSGSPWVG